MALSVRNRLLGALLESLGGGTRYQCIRHRKRSSNLWLVSRYVNHLGRLSRPLIRIGSTATKPSLRKSNVSTGGHELYKFPVGAQFCSQPWLLETLRTKLDFSKCRLHLNKRLDRYTALANGSVMLYFDKVDTPVRADVLIGADGITSSVRATMFKGQPSYVDPKFSGVLAHRGAISLPDSQRINRSNAALFGYNVVS